MQLNRNLQRVAPAYVTILFWSIASSISLNGPIMPLYVKSLGIGSVGWGVLAAAWGLGMFLTEWFWGSLSDSRDRRRLILLSALSMSVLFALFTVIALIPIFIVLELLAGAMGCALGPTTRTHVTDESPERSVGFFASLWWTAFMFGQVIGPILGSFIAETLSFAYSFYASSFLAVVMAVFVLWSFPTTKHHEKRREINTLKDLKLVLGLRSTRLLFILAVLLFIGRSLIVEFLPLYASSVIQMPTFQVGLLIATFSGTQLVAMPTLGWLSDRAGLKRTAFLSYAVSAFLFLLYFLATTAYQLFLVSIAVGVGLSGAFLLLAMIPTVTARGTYGKVLGAYGSFEDLGIMIGPIIYGFVWSAYGPVYIFLVCALANLLAAFLVLGIRNARKDSHR